MKHREKNPQQMDCGGRPTWEEGPVQRYSDWGVEEIFQPAQYLGLLCLAHPQVKVA